MTHLNRTGLVVARMPGHRLFLTGASGSRPTFQGPSERTIFFRPETAERELKRFGVDPSSVELREASIEVTLG